MHFKLCSIKFNYVIVSWFIAVYYLLLAVYLAHHSFTDVHKLPKHYAGRFQATFDYAARLVIELVGTACLAWGIAFRDINCLLVWLGVAISFVIRNITSKILYLLYGGVLINTTDMWIHCVIIVLDILSAFIVFSYFFALREKTAMLIKSLTSIYKHSFTFKINLQKISFASTSLIIAVYVQVSCIFSMYTLLTNKNVGRQEVLSYSEITDFYLVRLIVKMVLAVFLIYGALWKKSYVLLFWTCISLSFLATIHMEKDRKNMYNYNDIVLNTYLYICCVLDTLALFTVFNFFLNVRDSNSRLKNCAEITRIATF